MRNIWRGAVLAAGVALGAAGTAAAQAPPCAAGAELAVVCGFRGAPEDLVQIPGTDWVIASGFTGQGTAPGGISLLNVKAKTQHAVAIAAARARAPYTDCDGSPDPSTFSTHGLNLRVDGRGRGTLFAVGHGGREAIEVFDVRWAAGEPKIAWIGCVKAVPGAFNNSVVHLKDGRIVATDFRHAGTAPTDMAQGKPTGAVYNWKAGAGWEKLPGSELPGANGVEATPDGRWLFVAVSGTSAVLRWDLRNPAAKPAEVKPGVRTDNIRWGPDGKLLLGGPDIGACKPGEPCRGPPAVAVLDPATLKVERLYTARPDPAFPSISVGIVVGDTLWMGSPSGDRAAYAKLK